MAQTKVDKGAIANKLFTNDVFIYILVFVVGGLAIYFIAPVFFNRIKAWLTGFVDTIFGGLADIFGRPQSQDPAKRTGTDSVRGLVVEGDRALSDLYDKTFGTIF